MTVICNEYVKRSNASLKAIQGALSDDIQSSFSDIGSKLTDGANIAEQQATDTCSTWGRTVSSKK